MKRFVLTVLLLFFVTTSARAEQGETSLVQWIPACQDYEKMVEYLKKYGERAYSLGTTSSGVFLEIFISEARSRPWTLVAIYANGVACILMTGYNWKMNDCTQATRRTHYDGVS